MVLAKALISPSIPVLSIDFTGNKALAFMRDAGFDHLPLVNEDKYIALLSLNDVENLPDLNLSFEHSDWEHSFAPIVYTNTHIYEIIKMSVQRDISIIPVLDLDDNYFGAIHQLELLKGIITNTGLETNGGIVVLEIKQADYSLSEIARICENNNSTIIHAQINTNPHSDKIVLSIKINSKELQPLIAAFLRYEYVVLDFYGDDFSNENIMDRYTLLMNYINM